MVVWARVASLWDRRRAVSAEENKITSHRFMEKRVQGRAFRSVCFALAVAITAVVWIAGEANAGHGGKHGPTF